MMKQKLDNKLKELMPLKNYLYTAYARNGLYLLIKALNLGENDEVIIPAFTCSIIPKSIREAGAVPVSVDSEENGLNIDPGKIRDAIGARTKAIYVIHTYGTTAQMDKICSIAREHGIYLIEDLAHSLFTTYRGKQLGTFGDFAIISFNKKIINFEGGAVGTDNDEIFQKLLELQAGYGKFSRLSFEDIIINGARFIGSIWESRFSVLSMLVLKTVDRLNNYLFQGHYGLSINGRKFHMHPFSMWLACIQLGSLYKKVHNAKYERFKSRGLKGVTIVKINQKPGDRLPEYYSGIINERRELLNLLSFRTWINYNEPGKYPRADFLYQHYRIFSWLIYFVK